MQKVVGKPNPEEDLPVVHQPLHVGPLPDRGGPAVRYAA